MYLIKDIVKKYTKRVMEQPEEAVANATIADYLRSWGLEIYIDKFIEHSIDLETLQMLSETDLRDLVPVIGHRAKLAAQIKILTQIMSSAFVQTNQSNILYEYTTIEEANTQPDQVDPAVTETLVINEPGGLEKNNDEEVNCELYELLSSCNEGKGLLLQYQEKGLLNNASRRRLCHLIIDSELKSDPEKKIPSSRFYQLAYEISKIFKQESSSVYFIPFASFSPLQKISAKGKLLDHYRQRRRDFIKSGIIKVKEKRCSSTSSNYSSGVDSPLPSTSRAQEAMSHLDDNTETDLDIEDKLIWLQNNCDPWSTVELNWQLTTKKRLNDLASKDMTIDEYFTKYKPVNQPAGIYLILKDFKVMFPLSGDKFDENWLLIRPKLIEMAKKKGLISNIDDYNEEGLDMAAITSLPFLMNTSNVTSTRKSTKNQQWRPSKQEVLEGFIIQVNSPAEIAETITRKRSKLMSMGLQLQPFIMVVGLSKNSITSRYIIINNIHYEMPSIVKAVDACLKAIFVLNAEYPKECCHVWQFIQRGIFKIKTKYDKCYTTVNTLMADLCIKDTN